MLKMIYVRSAVKVEVVEFREKCLWAAGFFDGEGTTSVLKAQRDRYAYLRMSVSQKDPTLLHKFQDIFKCGKVYHNKRGVSSWDCYKKEEVLFVLDSLWPFISEQKKAQAQKAIQYVKEHSKV